MTAPPDSDDVVRAKVALRARAKAAREAIPAAERASRAQSLAALDLPRLLGEPPPAAVSAFASMGAELDTAPLLARLAGLGYRLALPVMQGKERPLVFRAWAPGDAMATAVWGIAEPMADKPVVMPDIVLVPLLAFDRRGHRLGYGGGYFDRTIRALRATRGVRAVGLAFAEQEVDAVPHLDYDERLDAVLTPGGLVTCGS